jgi:hypothetical protein
MVAIWVPAFAGTTSGGWGVTGRDGSGVGTWSLSSRTLVRLAYRT